MSSKKEIQISLSLNQFKQVKNILNEFVPQYEVGVFGSRAKGTPKPHSDLDLVIKSEEPLPPLILANLREAFSESNLPMKVDLVDWATTDTAFRKIIDSHYISIQSGK